MKIGIITFWTSEDNYGQILQSFALQRFLRNKGHEAFVVKYTLGRSERNWRWWLTVPFKVAKRVWHIIAHPKEHKLETQFKEQAQVIAAENAAHPRNFSDFKNKHINYTATSYTERTLYENPPQADAFIAGSDQIWNGLHPSYFLQFAPEGTKCIAYAPSFGGAKLEGGDFKRLQNMLKRFSALMMREQSGVEACQRAGRKDAFMVPDPTLLLSSDSYKKVMTTSATDNKYALLYMLGHFSALEVDTVFEWADRRGLKVKYVAAQGRTDHFEKSYPNVDEWLELIDKAECVITNSFHGTVFSIIFNKKFLTVPLTGGFAQMNCRIHDLLTSFNIEGHIYAGNMDDALTPIDYTPINEKLKADSERISKIFEDVLGA